MAITKWNGNPFSTLITDYFDYDRFLPKNWLEPFKGFDMPAANIKENDKEYKIEVAAPGLDKKDFKIEVENGTINISGEKKEEKNEEKENYTRHEFSFSSFKRSFQVPESVNADDIKSTYNEGILHLTLPKKEEAKKAPKKLIEVS